MSQERERATADGAVTTLREHAYQQLKRMILSGRLRPGERLHERELTALLGVSRTPVREALSQLGKEGLIVHRPQRGYVVQSHSAETVESLYALREVLERHAIGRALERATEADMEEMRALGRRLKRYERNSAQSAEELREGQRVHEAVARAARDEFLYDTLMRLYDRLELFVWIEVLYEDDAPFTRGEHQALIESFVARDRKRMVRLAAEHVRRSRANVLRALKARPSLAL